MPEVVELPEDHLFNVFNILLLEDKHRLVKQLKRSFKPSVHGHKTWFSSYLIMDYLQTHNLLKKNTRVLELGCGWGATSIYCAKNGAKSVTGLDIDENVFPFLETQAALNNVEIATLRKSYDKLTGKQLANYSLILGGDICFWDSLSEMLLKLVRRGLRAGVKQFIFADPGRPPFLELAEKCSSFAKVSMNEWYVCDPEYHDGYILDIRL